MGSKKFIGNQPITLSESSYNKNTKYFITVKLDGRRFLLKLGKSSCLISSKVEKIPLEVSLKEQYILDGEMYNNVYHAFDILLYKGKDTKNLDLGERLLLLKTFLDEHKIDFIVCKKYYTEDVCKDFKYLIKTTKFGDKYDGIIFTPNEHYYAKVLKWKPPELLSIDFKIRKKDNKFYVLNQDNTIFKNRYTNGVINVIKEIYDKYSDGCVLEVIFDKNKKKFKILRDRPDKNKSNYKTVIKSNFDQIINPVDINKLLCN